MNKNKFNLSHERLLTLEAGKLVPFLTESVLPGDDFQINSNVFSRVMPMVAPVMASMNLRLYYFFVPERLVWDDYEEFHTRGRDNDSIITVPRIGITNTNKQAAARSTLLDYFGIPTIGDETVSGTHYFVSLPLRAYIQIYNDYFRNQEVQDEILFDKSSLDADSNEFTELTNQRWRNWDMDYFTSAKAQATLNADINGYIQVQSIEESDIYKGLTHVHQTSGSHPANSPLSTYNGDLTNGSSQSLQIQNLNTPLGIDLDDIRRISGMQRWMETLIRVGYRYTDYLKGIWDVTSSDLRLQQAEYLGGMEIPYRISEVLNTSDTANAPQGDMAGHGVGSGRLDNPIRYTAQEHGYIIGLVCITPKASYYQGVHSLWKRFDYLDYANPMLDDLGMQELPSGELYYNFADSEATNMANFGYKPRYADYKTGRESAHGDFRDTLNFWHFGRSFATRPTLSQAFCSTYGNIRKDAFAVESGDQFLLQIENQISVLRALSYFSNPRI